MKTIDYFRTRRALAILMASLALGGVIGSASGQVPMYRMQNLGAGGGVPAVPASFNMSVTPSNTVWSWYGLMGWTTIYCSTNAGGPFTNFFASTEATSYPWSVTAAQPTNQMLFFSLVQSNSYASSQPCSACHSAQYVPWTSTAHANAYNALAAIGMNNNSECILCHTTGNGQPTGFSSAAATPNLEGVGCESCHGAAGWHKNSDHTVILPAVSVDPEICGSCHQGFNPQYNEYTNSPHYLVNDEINYGVEGGVYYTNTVIIGNTTYYGYYVTTNANLTLKTNATSGIFSSSAVPGYYVDPGQSKQATCGICHSGAARVAMLNNYAAQQAGTVTPLVFPTAADAGAWGPSCATCHDPHALTPSPVFGDISNAMVVIATNWVQLRSPLWSSNYYTMVPTADERFDPLGNPYYMNTTFMSLYNPNINICGQCHNTRGARWDGLNYGLNSNSIPVTNSVVSYVTYTTNYNMYGNPVVTTFTYPFSVANSIAVTNTTVTNTWVFTTGLITNNTGSGFSRAPHLSPQYNMLIGILEPDYFNTTNGKSFYTNGLVNGIGIYATHAGIAAKSSYNTNQCVTCHVPSYTSGTGGNVTGHTFQLDPNGCALGGCHSSGPPDYADYKIENSNLITADVDLLNRWSTNNAQYLLAHYTNYLLNSWEYTSAGSLGVQGQAGPTASDQLLLPAAILQARFDVYMVFSDGSLGTHNPTLIPLLLKDAETKVLSQFNEAKFTAAKNYAATNVSLTFSNLSPGVITNLWSFGDNTYSTSTAATVTHAYANPGTYNVSLAVNGANGFETLQRNNYANIYVLPTPSFAYGVGAAYTNGSGIACVPVSFTNTSANANYGSWSCYNSATASGTKLASFACASSWVETIAYTNSGSYAVVLSASNPGGSLSCTNSVSVTVP